MLNNGKVKNESACAQQNADLLKKISLMGTEITATSKTSIDHIYTNANKSNVSAGVIDSDLSDHYGLYTIISKIKRHQKRIKKHIRYET